MPRIYLYLRCCDKAASFSDYVNLLVIKIYIACMIVYLYQIVHSFSDIFDACITDLCEFINRLLFNIKRGIFHFLTFFLRKLQ